MVSKYFNKRIKIVDENKTEIRKQGGIGALINTLSLTDDAETVKHCIRALSILSIDGSTSFLVI
jgi:hypothetical protein